MQSLNINKYILYDFAADRKLYGILPTGGLLWSRSLSSAVRPKYLNTYIFMKRVNNVMNDFDMCMQVLGSPRLLNDGLYVGAGSALFCVRLTGSIAWSLTLTPSGVIILCIVYIYIYISF